jgi:subtilase family serine protease
VKGRGRTLAVGLVVAAATVALAAPGGSSAAGAPRKTLAGTVPSWASAARDRGEAQGKVRLAVALRWRHGAALEALDRAVSTPGSSAYAHYLSPSQFRARFSPSSATVARVKTFLRSSGLRVQSVSKSRMLVDAEGSTRNTERAFHTDLRRYRQAGHTLRAAAKPASLPSSVAADVAGVVGLDETLAKPLAPPPPLFRNAHPCSHYWGEKFASSLIPHAYGQAQPFAPCGYDAQQFQSAYGVDKALADGIDGTGQSVAVIDAFAAPTIQADVDEYSSRHGLPPATISQTVAHGCHFGCSNGVREGWYGEETLDLEAVHSMAPGADLAYYGAADVGGKALLDSLVNVLDDGTASIITNSYGSLGEGLPKPAINAQEEAAKQAIAQGVGIYFSSGDDGDERSTIGFVSADYPASSPRMTAVGGTSLGVGPTGHHRFEVGWGTKKSTLVGKLGSRRAHFAPAPPGDFLYGSGGGTSRLFGQPSYQHGVVPPALVNRFGGRGRVVPDISMDGDPTTGMLVGETQTAPDGSVGYDEYRIGGTSLSSPLFAGYMALANQHAGFSLGFANPALYALAGSGAIRDVRPAPTQLAALRNDFNNGVDASDDTTISLRSFDLDSSLHTKKGYDDVTGLGSPAGAKLLYALGGP